jgi:hypothetical protein
MRDARDMGRITEAMLRRGYSEERIRKFLGGNLLRVFRQVTEGAPGATAAAAPLLFREDWAVSPAATPVTQEHVANPDLVLTRHGPAQAQIKKSHHDQPADDPYYVWSGDTEGNWALSLRPRTAMDLSGDARIRWRARQSGFRALRLVLSLGDGRWVVSEEADGPSDQWRVRDFDLRQMRWRALDIAKVVEGRPVDAPDLSRVVEIGFTDLMRGGGTPASSRLDWIEVYGRAAAAAPAR